MKESKPPNLASSVGLNEKQETAFVKLQEARKFIFPTPKVKSPPKIRGPSRSTPREKRTLRVVNAGYILLGVNATLVEKVIGFGFCSYNRLNANLTILDNSM